MRNVLTVALFVANPASRRFADVTRDPRVRFQELLDFFNNADRQQRMMDSEIHHDRPALAGVIRELENHTRFGKFLAKNDAHSTLRARQGVGMIVRLIMEGLGWRKTNNKGALGQRLAVKPTAAAGAYRNRSGLSTWFTKAERYEPPKGYPYPKVEAVIKPVTDKEVSELLKNAVVKDVSP